MEIIKAELIPYQISNTSTPSNAYLQKAYRFYEKNEFDSVLVYCHKLYAIDSDNWQVYYLYGLSSYQVGDTQQASEYYYKALSFCTDEPASRARLYFALAVNEDSIGNHAKATQQYMMVMQLDKDSKLAKLASQKMQLLSKSQ